MRRIDLNDLPKWSVWPARMLGLVSWDPPCRTIDKIDKEYDKDKYARCLDYFINSDKTATPEQVKKFEFNRDIYSKTLISIGDELYESVFKGALERYYHMIIDNISSEIKDCKTIVELGAGYGFNLWLISKHMPNLQYFGGEYSKNAIALASYLYTKIDTLKLEYFNFYESRTYKFFESLESPILVFTGHAIEQLPKSSPFFDNLELYKHKIKSVFHFEPVYELHDETLIGMLRRRYAMINNYNTDLISELKSRSSIKIVKLQPDVMGLNPLNPTSIVQWVYDDL